MLALVAIVQGSLFVAEASWFTMTAPAAGTDAAVVACAQGIGPCGEASFSHVAWMAGWAVATLVLALAGAAAASTVRRRMRTPLPIEQLVPVATANAAAANSLGLEPVALVWRPRKPIAMARADGVLHPYIEVGPALLASAVVDPARCAAVLRHEYAHHGARDVLPSRLVLAAAVSWGLLTVPLLATIGWNTDAAQGALRLVLVAALVALARWSVLRDRERRADAAAAAIDLPALQRALGSATGRPTPAWRRAIADHPPVDQRHDDVADPGARDRLRPADAALAAGTAMVGAPLLTRIVAETTSGGLLDTYPGIAGWGTVGALFGAWLGLALWPADPLSVRGGPARNRPLAELALATGATSLVAAFLFDSPLLLAGSVPPLRPVAILPLLLLVGGTVVLVVWASELAGWLAGTGRTGRSSRLALGIATAAVTGLVYGNLGQFVHTGRLIGASEAPIAGLEPGQVLTFVVLAQTIGAEWFAVALLAAAVAVPTAVALGARQLRPVATALAVGLLAGLAASALFAAMRTVAGPQRIAERNGWLAAASTAYWLNATLVVSTALIVGLAGSVLFRWRQIVLTGMSAGVAAIVASVGAAVVLGMPLSGVVDLIPAVGPVTLVLSLVLACLLTWPPGGVASVRRRLVRFVPVGLIVTVLLAFSGLQAMDARPSLAADRDRYAALIESEGEDKSVLNALYAACVGYPALPADTDRIRRLEDRMSRADAMPGTPELRQVHEDLLTSLRSCEQSFGSVGPDGHVTQAAAPLDTSRAAMGRWSQAYMDLQGRVGG